MLSAPPGFPAAHCSQSRSFPRAGPTSSSGAEATMRRTCAHLAIVIAAWLAMLLVVRGQSGQAAKPAGQDKAQKPAATAQAAQAAVPDVTKQPTLFVVGYAHLDT